MAGDIDAESQRIFHKFMSIPSTLPEFKGELTGFVTGADANKLHIFSTEERVAEITNLGPGGVNDLCSPLQGWNVRYC
jgi:hypothetical protein